jgi:hypothetical protein
VDLLVEEPSGTVCSFRNPRTTSGGVILSDSAAVKDPGRSDMNSEIYVCPQGFEGTYRVLLRRVWGKLTADKATVDIYWHYHSKDQRHLRKQIELGDDDALALFELEKGRREQPLEEEQVANAVAGQVEVGRQILAQQLNVLADPRTLGSFLSSRNRAGAQNGNAGNNPFVVQGAVGYQPVIIVLPEGSFMSAVAVVSADRRYVRVTPTPFFSGISEVNTFNFATGESGTSQGGGGGGFSGGGGGGLGGGF